MLLTRPPSSCFCHKHCPGLRSGGRSTTRSASMRRALQEHDNPSPQLTESQQPPQQQVVASPVISPSLISQLWTELQSGAFWLTCEAGLPKPPWGLHEVIKVMQYGLPLGLAMASLQLVPALLYPTQAGDAAVALSDTLGADAARHFGQELLSVGAAAGLLWAALGPTQPRAHGMFNFGLSAQWASAVALLCAVLFPLVDPLLYTPWSAAVREATCLVSDGACSASSSSLGLSQLPLPAGSDAAAAVQAAARPFKDALVGCVQGGDYGSLGLHVAATCLLGPLWEETFWRGFILPSIASRLPGQLPAAVACSSLTFAWIHLSVAAGLPILILSSACDILYLRSASLGPPLMLHAAWNAYQIVGVAFCGKEAFV